MAYTVADSRTLLTANDNVGTWSESTTSYYVGADDGGLEGSGFVGFDLDIETIVSFEEAIAIPLDITGIHLGVAVRVTNAGSLDTKANGGVRLGVRDNSGNESYFYVGGSDTYPGGWAFFVADMSGTPDANNGANAVITDALYFGVGGKCLAKSLDDNFQIDIMKYGTGGITVTGSPDTGTYGVGKSFVEIHDIIKANFLGVMNTQVGSFVARAPIHLDCDFNDSDSSVYFDDQPVSDTFYKIDFEPSGVNEISFVGFSSQTVGLTAAELDFSAVVASLVYNASTAINQGITTFQAGNYTGDKFVGSAGILANAGANLDSFTIEKTGLVDLTGSATLTNSNIKQCPDAVSSIVDSLDRVIDNSYESTGSNHAVELRSFADGASVNWSNKLLSYVAGVSGSPVTPTSTGNEALFVNQVTGTLSINVAAGANTPSIRSAGATVNVVAGLLTLTINGLVDGESEVRVRDGSFTLPGGYVASASGTSFTMTFSPYAVLNHVTLSVITPGFDYINKPIELFNKDVTENLTLTPDPSWVP